jgi:hypothetical protein
MVEAFIIVSGLGFIVRIWVLRKPTKGMPLERNWKCRNIFKEDSAGIEAFAEQMVAKVLAKCWISG